MNMRHMECFGNSNYRSIVDFRFFIFIAIKKVLTNYFGFVKLFHERPSDTALVRLCVARQVSKFSSKYTC